MTGRALASGPPLRVLVVGLGKAGSALADALARAGALVERTPGRAPAPPRRRPHAVVIATRDRDLAAVSALLDGRIERGVPFLHLAGALDEKVLRQRNSTRPVAQMHPLLSVVKGSPPLFRGASFGVSGDPVALAAAARIAGALGGQIRHHPGLSRSLYHAAAALAANGAAALAQASALLLQAGGVPEAEASRMLAPLLASVARHVGQVGAAAALSGPVRRGDVDVVRGHLAAIETAAPALLPLYRAALALQLPLAESLAEATPAQLRALRRLAVDRPPTPRAVHPPRAPRPPVAGESPPERPRAASSRHSRAALKVPQSPGLSVKRPR